MLRIALAATVFLLSAGMTAYALDNSDLIQLNLRMSRQAGRQPDVMQLLEPVELARLREQAYQDDLMGQRQQERVKEEHYQQELLWEWQRRNDARTAVDRGLRDVLMQRERAGLFQ